MQNIEDLFIDSPVATTPEVARFFEISESEARAWGAELGVSKVGASYAWSEDDVRRLEEEFEGDLDEEEVDGEEDDDDEELAGEEDDGELDDE
jgi:hypothetical protein